MTLVRTMLPGFAALALTSALVAGTASTATAQTDKNCDDFATQGQAQEVFDRDPSDPHGLDRDGDDKACETLPVGGGNDGGGDNGDGGDTPGGNGQDNGGVQAGTDRDCSDFATQAAAQAVLSQHPSDPNNLDADGDGIACETLPGGNGEADEDNGSSSNEDSDQVGTTPPTDRDCADFASQPEAQAVLDANPSDPNGLDADDDGIACETTSGSGDPTDKEPQVTTVPEGGVDTGGGGTAGNPTSAGLYALGSLLLVSGALMVSRIVAVRAR